MTRPRKQTSSRVSTLAARLMRKARRDVKWNETHGFPWDKNVLVESADLITLCASVLSQDETRGQAKKRGRKR